jgi:hypothetical protein
MFKQPQLSVQISARSPRGAGTSPLVLFLSSQADTAAGDSRGGVKLHHLVDSLDSSQESQMPNTCLQQTRLEDME